MHTKDPRVGMTGASERWSAGWWDWRRVGCALLIWKLLYFGVLWVALVFWGDMEEARFRAVMMHWPRDSGPVFASHFATWDGAHYLYLSEEGYGPGVRSNAFYPLYPLLMRWTSALTGGSHLIAGFVLANLFSLVGWVLFYQVARCRFGPEVALWATVFLVLFPGALFYQFVYTEGLFFLLVMLVWMGLERERYGWVCVGAFLLPLTRAIGLFVLLPIAWHLMTRRPLEWMVRLGTDRWDSRPRIESKPKENLGCYAVLLAPLAGWMVYVGLMWHWTGKPFDGFAAQRYWATHSIWNLIDVPKFVMALFNPTEWHAYLPTLTVVVFGALFLTREFNGHDFYREGFFPEQAAAPRWIRNRFRPRSGLRPWSG